MNQQELGYFKEQRVAALQKQPKVTGLDFIVPSPVNSAPNQWLLLLYFVPKSTGQSPIPTGIRAINLVITRGDEPTRLGILQVNYPDSSGLAENVLQVLLDTSLEMAGSRGNTPEYTLEIINISGLDPFFRTGTFRLTRRKTTEMDCSPGPDAGMPYSFAFEPEINYLARDYTELRTFLLDRLSLLLPGFKADSEADLMVVLAEAMAYAADHLSYYQDGVATEAYLDFARLRTSVARHARLVNYRMLEGNNARAWVHVLVGATTVLSAKTQLVTRSAYLLSPVLNPNSQANIALVDKALDTGSYLFETLYEEVLEPQQNEITIYTWGARPYLLQAGATSATLSGDLTSLSTGSLLAFQEVRSPEDGQSQSADVKKRQVVRLTGVRFTEDPLGGQFLNPPEEGPVPITEVTWHLEDALEQDYWVVSIVNGELFNNCSMVYGNLVLADQGRLIEEERLETVPDLGTYEPALDELDITYATPFDEEKALAEPTTFAVYQDPQHAAPQIQLLALPDGVWQAALELQEQDPERTIAEILEDPANDLPAAGSLTWVAVPDLLESNAYAQVFVLELTTKRSARLRFGNGFLGKRPAPGTVFLASYRVGNGSKGNVGADTLVHILTDNPNVVSATNPIAAMGGTDPETNEQVKQFAPEAFRVSQERLVTSEDYNRRALEFAGIQKAATRFRWTGSWTTVFMAVDLLDGKLLTRETQAEIEAFIEPSMVAGFALKVIPPQFVSLDIEMEVMVEPDYVISEVREQLEIAFGTGVLPDGSMAFFNPDRLSFNESVYQSQVQEAALAVDGVSYVTLTRFQRWGLQPQVPRDEVPIGPLEIARLENDPSAPQNGVIGFNLEPAP